MDPKRFYKRTDAISSQAVLGTVIAGAFDRSSQTLKRKERETSIVGEFMADNKIKAYTKRKYREHIPRSRGEKYKPSRLESATATTTTRPRIILLLLLLFPSRESFARLRTPCQLALFRHRRARSLNTRAGELQDKKKPNKNKHRKAGAKGSANR